MAQLWGTGKQLPGGILLQNSRAHGFWENAMWEVAEQVSADAAPQPGGSQVSILQYTVLHCEQVRCQQS